MKILFITLSNIGDCILTLDVLDVLMDKYPQAEFTVFCCRRAKDIFYNNKFIPKVISYDKKAPLKEKIELAGRLFKEKYDLVADLRHTILPFLLIRPVATKLFNLSKPAVHMRQRHMEKLKRKFCIGPRKKARKHFFNESTDISKRYKNYVVFSPGAKSRLKRWPQNKFIALAERIIREWGPVIILVGDSSDREHADAISEALAGKAVNLTGKTSLRETADLIRGADIVVSSDSACMHLAGYLDVPVAAIFGPTDKRKYAPLSDKCIAVSTDLNCAPCQKAQCSFNIIKCMEAISVDRVFEAVNSLLRHVTPKA